MLHQEQSGNPASNSKEFEMLCPQQAGLGCRKKMRNGLARQFHALKLTLSLQRQKFSVQAIFKNCRRL
jgi:hypothetical protein